MGASTRWRLGAGTLFWIAAASVAAACLWDTDTIYMERSRFPTALELITGKFLRHSREFYHWRINDRLRRLQQQPKDPQLLDDLAVAYEKTGQHRLAIETALKNEEYNPGRYENAANLGTFYIHAGELEKGLTYIDRALAINPNAHFGREKYQKLLVQYVLARRKSRGPTLPLCLARPQPAEERAALATKTIAEPPQETEPLEPDESKSDQQAEQAGEDEVQIEQTFAQFVWSKSSGQPPSKAELAEAVKGVLGMMRFGQYDSPVLLEALGSLLAPEDVDPELDARLLAARAYLMASYMVPEEPAKAAYRALADRALWMQVEPRTTTPILLADVEREFKKELAEATQWYVELRQRELEWIRSSTDPEVEFAKLYSREPAIGDKDDTRRATKRKLPPFWLLAAAMALAIGFPYVIYRKGLSQAPVRPEASPALAPSVSSETSPHSVQAS